MKGRTTPTLPRHGGRLAALLLLWLLPALALAETLVLADNRNSHHREFVSALGEALGTSAVAVFDVDGVLPPERDWRRVVAVGARAGERIAELGLGERRLYAMVPQVVAAP